MKDEAPGPWNVEEVIPTVADKKISPKAPTGSSAKKSGAQAATRVQKVQKVQKVQRKQKKQH
jgi:hypothetical protein